MADDKTEIELEKLGAEADKAKADAAVAKRAEAEATTPAAVARREALAEQAVAKARHEQVAALVPDLGAVQRGELNVAEGAKPTAGTPVGGRALDAAATKVAGAVAKRLGEAAAWSILVTSDDALAASDAAYRDVAEALESLVALAEDALAATGKPAEGRDEGYEVAGPEVAVASAFAKAVPGVLSLLSTHRSVNTGGIDMDDLAASAAVAGALKAGKDTRKVFHDSVRLVEHGGIYKRLAKVRKRRGQLLTRQRELEAFTPTEGDDEATRELAASIGLAKNAGESIDKQLEALTTIPEGATQSPLTAAALRQGLHGRFGYTLLVKAQSASGMQLVNDKPLWWKDTVSVLAVVSITWLLIDSDGAVVDGGVATESAQLNGKIGKSVEFAD